MEGQGREQGAPSDLRVANEPLGGCQRRREESAERWSWEGPGGREAGCDCGREEFLPLGLLVLAEPLTWARAIDAASAWEATVWAMVCSRTLLRLRVSFGLGTEASAGPVSASDDGFWACAVAAGSEWGCWGTRSSGEGSGEP